MKCGEPCSSFRCQKPMDEKSSKKQQGGIIMPEFSTVLPSAKAGQKLNQDELVRAIRFMIAAEYEAVGLYTQLAECTDCQRTRTVLVDIADEERIHAGEFLRLLQELDPEECLLYKEGAEEVEEILEKLKTSK